LTIAILKQPHGSDHTFNNFNLMSLMLTLPKQGTTTGNKRRRGNAPTLVDEISAIESVREWRNLYVSEGINNFCTHY